MDFTPDVGAASAVADAAGGQGSIAGAFKPAHEQRKRLDELHRDGMTKMMAKVAETFGLALAKAVERGDVSEHDVVRAACEAAQQQTRALRDDHRRTFLDLQRRILALRRRLSAGSQKNPETARRLIRARPREHRPTTRRATRAGPAAARPPRRDEGDDDHHRRHHHHVDDLDSLGAAA